MSNYHNHPSCDEFTYNVKQCHAKYGKLGEECVREELEQKKCLAQLYCPKEAYSFYQEPIVPSSKSTTTSLKVSCSTVVEMFAKPENELLIPEGSITVKDRQICREITHSLAKCLSKKARLQI